MNSEDSHYNFIFAGSQNLRTESQSFLADHEALACQVADLIGANSALKESIDQRVDDLVRCSVDLARCELETMLREFVRVEVERGLLQFRGDAVAAGAGTLREEKMRDTSAPRGTPLPREGEGERQEQRREYLDVPGQLCNAAQPMASSEAPSVAPEVSEAPRREEPDWVAARRRSYEQDGRAIVASGAHGVSEQATKSTELSEGDFSAAVAQLTTPPACPPSDDSPSATPASCGLSASPTLPPTVASPRVPSAGFAAGKAAPPAYVLAKTGSPTLGKPRPGSPAPGSRALGSTALGSPAAPNSSAPGRSGEPHGGAAAPSGAAAHAEIDERRGRFRARDAEGLRGAPAPDQLGADRGAPLPKS